MAKVTHQEHYSTADKMAQGDLGILLSGIHVNHHPVVLRCFEGLVILENGQRLPNEQLHLLEVKILKPGERVIVEQD